MDRRDFFKAAGFAGLTLASPFGFSRRALAQDGPYSGLLWIMVNAAGGWDPTSLCDPKGRANENEQDPMNMYLTADIEQAGNIRYAPVAGNAAFFQKWYNRLTVINGVDTATNGHDSGSRHTWSGRLAEGYPSLAAVIAGTLAPAKPLSFISNGGYDLTMGLVAPTRTGNTNALGRIAFPNERDPGDPDTKFHTDATVARIQAAQRARTEAMMQRRKLPRVRQAINTLYLARTGENEIRRLTEYLPDLDDSNNRLFRQAQLAIAAYKAGVTATANLNIGGFDTHGNHDQDHFPRLQQLTEGVDFIMTEAERQGVADKVVVVVGSDFGRTPGYNSGRGKDHWSITSMMLMGPGIPGNRVIGSTDERHNPHKVNPQTLERDDNGVRIKPGHIHRALRRLAGIQNDEIARTYPITAEDLPILG